MQTFPSNSRIAAALILKFQPIILSITLRMGVRYRLTAEDREDLIGSTILKIAKVDWRQKLRDNHPWLSRNISHKRISPSDAVAALTGYTYSLVRNSLRDEVHRLRSGGLGGLLGHRIHELPNHCEYDYGSEETEDQSDKLLAQIISEKARLLLTDDELKIIHLLYGFDGSGERTLAMAAKAAGIPRRLATELCESAMHKLRSKLNNK